MIVILGNLIEWIKTAFTNVDFVKIGFIAGVLVSVLGVIEKALKLRWIGTWFFEKIKSIFSYRSECRKNHESIIKMMNGVMETLKGINNEVQYNGGTKTLSSAVQDLIDINRSLRFSIAELLSDADAMFEFYDKMLWKIDNEGYLMKANRAFYEQFGLKESDVKGGNYENIIDVRDLHDLQIKIQRSIEIKANFEIQCSIKDINDVKLKCLITGLYRYRKENKGGFDCIITIV